MMQGGSRNRRVRPVLAALTGLALGLGSTLVASAPASAASLPVVQAKAADSLADSVGVCIHVGFLDTPYADATMVGNTIADLGVRHVRDALTMNTPWQYASMRTVNQLSKAKFDLIMGAPGDPDPAQYVDTVATQLPGAVETLEGTNEWDIFNGGQTDWATPLRDRQAQLYAAAKANPATAKLPVLAPSMAFPWDWSPAGNFGATADLGNGHLYPGGRNPSTDLSTSLASLTQQVNGKPVVVTETGYHNATNNLVTNATGHPSVSEDVAATYLPRTFLENFSRGALRTYDYELIDEFDDPALMNPEAHFGLLRHDLTRKPAYYALKNLISLVNDPGTTTFRPGSLGYQVTGGDSSLRQLLLQKRNGHFVLLLWRDVSVYDTTLHTSTPVTPSNLTVKLGSNQGVRVFRPNTSATAVSSYSRTTSVPLTLGAQVAALDIGPAGSTTTAVATSTATAAATSATAPAKPTITSSSAGRRSVVVTWRGAAPHGSAVTGYLVTAGSKQVTVPAGARRAVVRGLARHAHVAIAVRARNAVGWGAAAWSRTLRVR